MPWSRFSCQKAQKAKSKMQFSAEFLLQILIAVGSGFGAYAAIRSDLATLHERATEAQASAARAHDRIDQFHGTHRNK